MTMSLSHTRLTAGELPCSPTESICTIFKKTDRISITMQRELLFVTKIASNTENKKSYNSNNDNVAAKIRRKDVNVGGYFSHDFGYDSGNWIFCTTCRSNFFNP